MALLVRLAEAHEREPGWWAALEYFVCRAYRRAWRLQGMRGIVLALLWRMPRAVGLSFLRVSRRLLEMCRGRARIRRDWAPA